MKINKETYSVRAGWMIDGSGGPVRKDVIIDVSGGRIEMIRRAGEGHCWNQGPLIDYSDSTILPGLVDCHVHLAMSGSEDSIIREKEFNEPFEKKRGRIENNIRACIMHGIVAVRDGGDNKSHVLRYKEVLESFMVKHYLKK